MSESKHNKKAHDATINTIIPMDIFTKYSGRQKRMPDDIPEFDKTVLNSSDNLSEALEIIKAQGYFDWSKENGHRIGELEIEVQSLAEEERYLNKRIAEYERLMDTLATHISANALRLKRLREAQQ